MDPNAAALSKFTKSFDDLINTLKIPIQAWLASIKFIAGRNYSPITINDFLLLL